MNKESVLYWATQYGYNQIDWQEKQKMISFSDGITRINIYLTTGTVATCLDHPKHGKTQLFRRNVSKKQLKKIFENPRAHTGKGYYKSNVVTINHNLKINQMSQTNRPVTKVITGVVRLSFLHVWEPSSMQDGGPKKFSAALLIPKSDTETVKKIKAAIEAAKEEGKSKWGGKVPPVLKLPLRDGDAERPDDEVYKGHYFVNATSAQQPGVLDKDKNEMIDKTKLYSGCYAKVDVNFYAFNTNGNRGVACGLNNILKVKDGPALGGKEAAAVAFADVEVPTDDGDI